MERSTKKAWLEGPGDLKEADVHDVPVKGQSVRVRGLAAAYSNEAQSEALEMKTLPNGEQINTVNMAKVEILQFAHGCVDPTFTVQEAEEVSRRFGPAFKKVIEKIDELSGVDKDAVDDTKARFPVRGGGEDVAAGGDDTAGAGRGGQDVGDAASAGNGGPDLSVRTGS